MDKPEPEKTGTKDDKPIEFEPKLSEVDQVVERALVETATTISNVMTEFAWDSDRIRQKYPVRWTFTIHRVGNALHALAKAYEMFIESRLKDIDDQIKRQKMREMAAAKVALLESYERISKGKRV